MLSEQKRKILGDLLNDLSNQQIIWLAGFVTAKIVDQVSILEDHKNSIKELSIIYATETGNAKNFANYLVKKIKDLGIKVNLKAVENFDPQNIADENYLIFITSTHGQGDLPESLNEFWSFLNSNKPDLHSLKYHIIALGDSSYPLFCEAGIKLANKFAELNAKEWFELAKFDLDFIDNIDHHFQSLKQILLKTKDSKDQSGKVLQNIVLNDEGSNKEVHHIEIQTNAEYLPGDSLAIKIGNNSPRLYSISSSPELHQGQIHLTVRKLDNGLCSPYLANLKKGDDLKFYISPNNNFRLPEGDKNIIMVAAGTGIAPFRSFLSHRDSCGSSGKNWLFFGEQHLRTDFYYQSELQDYLQSNLLTKLEVAFSRDQEQKIYVQDKILENANELKRWIEHGAYFYVCGDKQKMAKAVEEALCKILGKNLLTRIKEENRYLKDIY